MTQVSRAWRVLPALILLMLVQSVSADDDLLVYVFNGGVVAEGVTIMLDGQDVGRTRQDGSLFVDLDTDGLHVLKLATADGEEVIRFSAGSGQLVDLIVDLASASEAKVDVYSRTESAADRRAAPAGNLEVTVRKGSSPAARELVVISNGQGAVSTNSQG